MFLTNLTRDHLDYHFSLPTQRCFPVVSHSPALFLLFSAYAEVFPRNEKNQLSEPSFLCLRRGVSATVPQTGLLTPFSLPTQRCFQPREILSEHRLLFSAYAEVFLDIYKAVTVVEAFLCLRRGVSSSGSPKPSLLLLFSAYAEVFLSCELGGVDICTFLCLRRGVSGDPVTGKPPTTLFSAYAEVFLP